MEKVVLPPIPAKRYFTIGEVSELCGVKPHVLRYWEQEFTQLRPVKRRGNRRYYQHHEVLLIRRIRELLYEQGFTIGGARQKLGAEEIATAPTARTGREYLLPEPALQKIETLSHELGVSTDEIVRRAIESYAPLPHEVDEAQLLASLDNSDALLRTAIQRLDATHKYIEREFEIIESGIHHRQAQDEMRAWVAEHPEIIKQFTTWFNS